MNARFAFDALLAARNAALATIKDEFAVVKPALALAYARFAWTNAPFA